MDDREVSLHAEQVLSILRNERNHEAIIFNLAPYMPVEMLPKVLDDVLHIEDPLRRFLILFTLMKKGGEAFREDVLPKAHEAALAIHSPEWRFQALLALSNTLRGVSKFSTLVAYSSLPEKLPEILHTASRIPDDSTRATALAAIAPVLSPELSMEGLEAARQIVLPGDRARALVEFVPRMPDLGLQAQVSEEVLDAAPYIKHWSTQASNFRRLNQVVPDPVIANALETELKLERPGVRTRALTSITPRLNFDQLKAVFESTKSTPTGRGRTDLLGAVYNRTKEINSSEAQLLRAAISSIQTDSLPKIYNFQSPANSSKKEAGLTSLWKAAGQSDNSVSEFLSRFEPTTAEEIAARAITQAYRSEGIQLNSSSVGVSGGNVEEKNLPQHIVSTGFSTYEHPSDPCSADHPLKPEQIYLFWLEVGAPVKGAIDKGLIELPINLLPSDIELDVVLLSNSPAVVVESPARGVLFIGSDRTVRVRTPAYYPTSLSPAEIQLFKQRLFFQVRTPVEEGEYRLRCSIFFHHVLVQSLEVTVRVSASDKRYARSLVTQLDYTLSRSLSSRDLQNYLPHKLSITVNRADDGTHNFHFVGEGDYQKTANFDTAEVQDLITNLRNKLRFASWGSETPWQADGNGFVYKYSKEPSFSDLLADLYQLAKEGYSQYDLIAGKIGRGSYQSDELQKLMRHPGLIQLALRESVRLVIPLALIYDYPFDDGLNFEDYKLCNHFQRCVGDSVPLDEQDCFTGNCPNYGDTSVICPSGFWGFRHEIGVPVTLVPEGDWPPAVPNEIEPTDVVQLAVAVCTDEEFQKRERHIESLRHLLPEKCFHYAESRDDTFSLMGGIDAQVFYFYCHGGVDGNRTYIQVGPMTGPRLTRSNLRTQRIRWDKPRPRPLVFINGCYTVNVEPEVAIEMVSGFINTAGASAVLGTEITVFEPLAVEFSERFLKSFVIDRMPLGKAVKSTRLSLLQQLNPLGLVYVPFGLASLRLANSTPRE